MIHSSFTFNLRPALVSGLPAEAVAKAGCWLLIAGLLTGCAVQSQFPPPPGPAAPGSQATSFAASSTGAAAEGDAVEAQASSSSVPPMASRLLPGELLEMGNPAAPLTMVLFTNHFCGYCKEFHRSFLPRLLTEFVEPGKMRVVTIPVVLQKYGRSGEAAAMLWCAAEQGQGTAMNDFLFSDDTGATALQTTLKDAGMDAKIFQTCVTGEDAKRALDVQKNFAAAFDASLVPAFFINGTKLVGLPQYADLRGAIEFALGQSQH